jgi:hypothetical protein
MAVQHNRTAMRLAFTGMALVLVVAGCGKDEGSSSKSSSASSSAATSAASSATSSAAASGTSGAAAPAAAGLTALVMKPESIPPTPAGPWVGDGPSVDPTPGNPPTAGQFYKSGDNSIQSTVILAPDADQAAKSVQDTLTGTALTSQIKGTLAPAPNVAKNAQVINGMSADGSASMSILMFSEGKVIAQVTFIGKPGDPVSADYLDTVGVIQLDAIQQNLSKLAG